MVTKKVCLVGATGAGKTSLVQRFAHQKFSPQITPAAGATINKARLRVDDEVVQMMLWDVQTGIEPLELPSIYFKGVAAIVYVVDGTASDSLALALDLKREIEQDCGVVRPSLVLINKFDLCPQWMISVDAIEQIEAAGMASFYTSAKSGEGVEEAFGLLGRLMLDKWALTTQWRPADCEPLALVGGRTEKNQQPLRVLN